MTSVSEPAKGWRSTLVRRIGLGCEAGVGALAIAAGLGWATGWRALASSRAMYIPMSPNTALCFSLLVAALFQALRGRRATRRGRQLAVVSAGVAGIIPLARLA